MFVHCQININLWQYIEILYDLPYLILKFSRKGLTMKTYKIIMLLTYISIASASAVIINPALPDIAREFDLSSGAVEWLVSIFLLGYVLGQIIYGPIAKRYGDVVNLGLGLLIMSVLVTWSIY